MTSRRSALLAHDNDYGFDPRTDASSEASCPSVCVVMPYFETGPLGVEAATLARQAVEAYAAHSNVRSPGVKMVVVDDGSVSAPFPSDWARNGSSVVQHEGNQGRTAARNTGLRYARGYEVTVFVDSDVFASPAAILATCQLAQRALSQGQSFVIPSFFSTMVLEADFAALQRLSRARVSDDWRWQCTYNPSWIGSAGDYRFVGRRFQLIEQSSYFRDWRGMVGPWCLPNMVLGGFFAVDTLTAHEVGGFDQRFSDYGFTETSLAAKMVCIGSMVIPQVGAAVVHVESNPAHHSQTDRNKFFRKAHRYFFASFLSEQT